MEVPPRVECTLTPLGHSVVFGRFAPTPAPAPGARLSGGTMTRRSSSAAVCGYPSLSIMFFGAHSAINRSAYGSIQVVTNVAMFSRALPSSISSSWTIW